MKPKSEVIHLEADITSEIMIPDYIKDFIPKHATVAAIVFKNERGSIQLQQRLVTYAHQSDIAALIERMKQGVKDVNGEFITMGVLRLKGGAQ